MEVQPRAHRHCGSPAGLVRRFPLPADDGGPDLSLARGRPTQRHLSGLLRDGLPLLLSAEVWRARDPHIR
jgi:hypothetical protein